MRMPRLLLLAMLFTALFLVSPALAQDQSSNGNGLEVAKALNDLAHELDSLNSLVKLGMTGVGIAFTGLTTALGYLWTGLRSQHVDHGKAIQELSKHHQTVLDAMRDRLDKEQNERREEAERLLRENQAVLREVMTLNATCAEALRECAHALRDLRASIEGNSS